MNYLKIAGVLTSLGLAQAGIATAQTEDQVDQNRRLDQIVVLGSAQDVTTFAGSAAYLEADLLDVHADTDVHRILRVVPGVNIQEEDGFGLRPNIGLRGTGLDRSSKITLMEDGVLIAPAPYAAPSAYYFPRAGRMSAVEVVKGPSAIKYGPRTQGGSINFVSTPISDDPRTIARLQGGQFNTLSLYGVTGGKIEKGGLVWGGQIEAAKDTTDGFKELDNGADTGFSIEDYVLKTSVGSTDNATIPWHLEFKGQYSDEISDETYLGLTREDFNANPDRRYTASAEDEMSAEHSEQSLRFVTELGGFDITTLAYQTEFKRDWFKLDRVEGVSISSLLASPENYTDALGVLHGADSSAGGLRLKHNNRDYEARGIQLVIGREFATGAIGHAFEVGIRLHEDEMDRYQWVEYWTQTNNDLAFDSQTVPGSDSNRIDSAEALAIHIKDDITIGRLTLSPGLRFEDISLKRENWGSDTDRLGAPSITENDVDVVIPGLGVSYEASDGLFIFGGVHKGFSPPAPGSTADAPEEAINYEAGLRWTAGPIATEAVAFFNDYDNLLGACTASTGGGCDIGDQFNGGAVEVTGLELSARGDLAEFTADTGFSFPASLAFTWTQAEFQSAFSSDYEPWGDVSPGDELPYIPEFQANIGLGIARDAWSLDINANWQDEARATAGSGSIALDDKIDARTLVDLTAGYDITETLRVALRVKNLTDEVYVAALRPSGLRPGLPRQFLMSIETRF